MAADGTSDMAANGSHVGASCVSGASLPGNSLIACDASANGANSGCALSVDARVYAQPPEGVDWANRWVELENATAGLEADRDALKVEVAQLRRQHVDQAMTALSTSTKAAAADSKEFRELQALLDEERSKAEKYLSEVVIERNMSTKLSEELQRRIAELASLSTEKLQIQSEKNAAQSELLPIRQERDLAAHERDEAEQRIKGLQAELTTATEERNTVFREKADLRHELTEQLNAARREAQQWQQECEEVQAAQAAAQQQAEAAEQRLREKSADFEADRKALEEKLVLRSEQQSRVTELRKGAQQQLSDAIRDRNVAVDAHAASAREAEELRTRIVELEEQLRRLKDEHEDLLRHRTAGTDAGVLPGGFQSLSELFHEATSAREEALQERQAKEQVQRVLQEVEHEVRTRYPALLRQREEVERLRHLAEQLTQQNESLLVQVRNCEAAKQDADAMSKKAQRSEQILEVHARDISKQMAVLVCENRRLSGAAETEGPEPDGRFFRTVQDLTEQNEALRKSVARLTEECKTNEQGELQAVREEREQEAQEWKKHLAERAEQMKALVDTIERLTHERDEAQRALKESKAAMPPLGSHEPAASRPHDAALREQLKALREEFAKCTEVLHGEAKELRASELKVRQELATVQGQLDSELSCRAGLKKSLQQAEKRLEERLVQLRALEDRAASLEESRRAEESVARDLESSLGQARRDLGHLDMQLKLERGKVTHLEQASNTLLAEKRAHGQLVVDLQARMVQESGAFREMKRDLEESYKQEANLLSEQLELSKQRQEELRQTAEELSAARAAREAEAAEAKAKATELKVVNAKLEEQLALRTEEIHKLHAAGNARPRRGAEVAAEAQAQLERSQASRERGLDVKKLEEKLQVAEEREQEHTKSAQLWQTLVRTHESELKTRLEEVAQLQQTVEALRNQHVKLGEECHKAQEREEQLEKKVLELNHEAAELRASLDKKDAEVANAHLEGEAKAHEVVSRLETAERESAGSRDIVEEWRQRHREAVSAHSKDIEVFDDVKSKYASLEKEAKGLRQRCSELALDAEQARTERADELETLRQRLEHAEAHEKSLAVETEKYQEKLLVISQQPGQRQDSEAVQWADGEMKRAREINELQRKELELDKARIEREARALRSEAADLQKRLDAAERQLLQMQTELRHKDRAVTKLGQLGLLEDENRRLSAEIKSLERERDGLRCDVDAKQLEVEPLLRTVSTLQKKEAVSEEAKKALEVKAEEWRRLHDEVVMKFNAHDVHEFKRLKEEAAQWQVKWSDQGAQVEKLQNELKLRTDELKHQQEEAANVEGAKERHKVLQKSLEQERQKVDKLTQQKGQLEEENKKWEAQVKHVDTLKILRDKRIAEMEKDFKRMEEKLEGEKQKSDKESKKLMERMEEEKQKSDKDCKKLMERMEEDKHKFDRRLEEERQKAEEAAKSTVRSAAALKLEEDVKADRALGLAMDFQRKLEDLVAKNRELREGGVGSGACSAASAATTAAMPSALEAEGSSGPKRKASSDEAAGCSHMAAPNASSAGGGTEGGPTGERTVKAARTGAGEAGGPADAASGTPSEAKATPKVKKGPTTAKAVARAVQAPAATGVTTSVAMGGGTGVITANSAPSPTSSGGGGVIVDIE